MTIRLVTDDTASLPPQWIKHFGIDIVELHVEELDGVKTTSAATPEEMTQVYKRALADKNCTGVVSVHLSQQLSRTWESAATAAARFEGNVMVVDSKTTGMAMGAAVAQSAALALTGKGLSAVYERANTATRSSALYICVERLDSLRKGGRIGAAVALIGSALHFHPVFKMSDGKLQLVAKARTATKALQRMRELARDDFEGRETVVAVHHGNNAEAAESVADHVRKEAAHPDRVLVVEMSSVLSTHVGAGTVALSVSDFDAATFHMP